MLLPGKGAGGEGSCLLVPGKGAGGDGSGLLVPTRADGEVAVEALFALGGLIGGSTAVFGRAAGTFRMLGRTSDAGALVLARSSTLGILGRKSEVGGGVLAGSVGDGRLLMATESERFMVRF